MSRPPARQVEFDRAAFKEARLAAGYTQEKLARAADLTVRTIQHYENGSVEPMGSTLLRLCSALEVAPEDLFQDQPEIAA